MNDLFAKTLSVLQTHKKKTILVVVLAGMYGITQHARRTKKFEDTLSKLEKKVQSQIEKEFKERAELLRKNANYDEIYTYFQGLDKQMKKNLRREIDSLFNIDNLRTALRNKDISPEEKKNLWDQLKEEIITQAVFSMVYISLSRTVLFIRECIINDQESLVGQDNTEDYRVLETFLMELSELVIVNGGKKLYTYIKEEIKPIISEAKVTTRYKKDDMFELIEKLQEKTIVVILENIKSKDLKSNGNKGGDGIWKILEERKKKEKKGKLLPGLPFPKFQVKALEVFTSELNNIKVSEEQISFEAYCKGIEERQENIDKLFLYEKEKRRKGSEENDVHEGGLLAIKDTEENKTKGAETGQDKSKRKFKAVKDCGNQFIDLLESGNLHLLALYALTFEFEKLKNRVLLYYKSKGSDDGILLATFLPNLQKIMQEEFISEEADEVIENFYNAKIKACLGYLRNKEASVEEMEISHRILKEAEMKKEVDNALKEFGQRIYLGADYEKVAQKGESGGDNKGLEQLLNGLSKTNMGALPEFE